jgi:hypothetical protein
MFFSFKFSDDDNSSVTSGSHSVGLYHSSPQSVSQNASQQLTVAQPVNSLEPLILQEIQKSHESNRVLHESIHQLAEEFETYKVWLIN